MKALVLVLSLLFLPSLAAAQERTAPAVRMDFDVPSIGIAGGTPQSDPGLLVSFGARAAARSGDGAFASFSVYDGSTGDQLFGPHPAQAGGWMVDTGYLRRFRLAGDDRFGLGLDVQGGLTLGLVEFRQYSSGLCFGDCASPPDVPESVANGLHAGGNVGTSLDLRLWGFTVGIDVRYRLALALEHRDPSERVDQHLVSAGVHLGFAIY